MDEIKQELAEWLSKSLLMEVNSDTVFFKDVGLGEEEIETFFHQFIEKYNIDAFGFDYTEYTPRNFMYSWFKGKKVKEFNLEHLYNVVKERKWLVPPSDLFESKSQI